MVRTSALTEYEDTLKRCIGQRRSIIYIETDDYYTEEERLKHIFRTEAEGFDRSDINLWLPDIGKTRFFGGEIEADTLLDSLRSLLRRGKRLKSILIIRGLHFYYGMQSDSIAQITTLLYEFCIRNEKRPIKERSLVIIISPKFDIPIELRNCIYSITPPLPDEKDIEEELGLKDSKEEIPLDDEKKYVVPNKNYIFESPFFDEGGKDVYDSNRKKLLAALKGLRIYDIRTLLSYNEPPYSISGIDINGFKESKKRMVQESGLLKVEDIKDQETYHEYIGDIDGLKRYMRKEKIVIDNRAFYNKKMPFPKGILLVGPPGCGKSETTKAIASILDMPLYSMDMGRLLGGLMGQSEHNFEKALLIAEAAQPCVLRIDEIEKAFAGSRAGENEQTMTHIIGHFLTWMQERKSLVYLVATANNLDQLRPEFLRKGRWDEIFYLNYPSAEGMKKIIASCLKKYGLRMNDVTSKDKKSALIGSETSAIIDDFYKAYSSIKVSGAEIVDLLEQIYKSQFVESMKSKIKQVDTESLSVELFKKKLFELAQKDRSIDTKKAIDEEIRSIEINQLIKNETINDRMKEIEALLSEKYSQEKINRMVYEELCAMELNFKISGGNGVFDREEYKRIIEKKYDQSNLIKEELTEIKVNHLLQKERLSKEGEVKLRELLSRKYKTDLFEQYCESNGYKAASSWPSDEIGNVHK